jgi:hypothetical protein
MIIKDDAGGLFVKVPGAYDGNNHTFDVCSTSHAIGYPRLRRYRYARARTDSNGTRGLAIC